MLPKTGHRRVYFHRGIGEVVVRPYSVENEKYLITLIRYDCRKNRALVNQSFFLMKLTEHPLGHERRDRYLRQLSNRRFKRVFRAMVFDRPLIGPLIEYDRAFDITVVRARRFDRFSDCSVCITRIATGDVVTRLECNHTYHTDCLAKWLLTCQTCPYCRAVIGSRVFHPPPLN